METNDTFLSARRGILPPCVNTKTWFDADNAWAYAMSVYVPSLTNAAAATGREMRKSAILQSIDDSLLLRCERLTDEEALVHEPFGKGCDQGEWQN